MAMLALGVATLIGSALFVWLYVGRNILRRIRSLQSSMMLLSSGDLESEIYHSRQHDEIAEMSSSLQVFRESMIAARALSADQNRESIAKAERASRMEARIAEFESTVRAALDSLATSANSMQARHVCDRRSVERAGRRGGFRRRGDLGQRADRLHRHRGTVLIDRRDRPPGRDLGGDRPQGRR
jgi:HAMP domain-containing protein